MHPRNAILTMTFYKLDFLAVEVHANTITHNKQHTKTITQLKKKLNLQKRKNLSDHSMTLMNYKFRRGNTCPPGENLADSKHKKTPVGKK